MGDRIPLELGGQPKIELQGELVAHALGLAPARLRELMEQRKISVLCERGTGVDAGLYRASFYHAGRRARFVVDARGQVLDPSAHDPR